MTDKQTFEGFDLPEQNWLKWPKGWTDITAEMTSIAEMKVAEYVLKHTWGYLEYGIKKRISVDEFMHGRKSKKGTRIDKGTGLSESSVKRGLRRAVQRGLIEVEVDGSDKARVKKYYGLRLNPHAQKDLEDRSLGVQSEPPGGSKRTPKEVKKNPRTEKDTLERQQQKEEDVVVVTEKLKNLHKELNVENKIDNPDTLAQELTKKYQTPEAALTKIDEKVRYYRYKIGRGKHIENPTGWIIDALKTDYAETGFKTQAQLEQEQKIQETKRQQLAETIEELDRQSEAGQEQNRKEQETALSKLQAEYGTTANDEALWHEVLSDLSTLLPKAEYIGLFSGTHLLKRQNGTAIIAVPNSFVQERLAHFQSSKIQQILSQRENKEIYPEFIVINQNAP